MGTVCIISSFCSFLLLFGIIRTSKLLFANAIFFVYGMDSFLNIYLLLFTFKRFNSCYNILFNCGSSNRLTKVCFPMVKTAALTWKFCCCTNTNMQSMKIKHHNAISINLHNKHGHHRVAQAKEEDDENDEIESKCHINCCFCCCGNEQEIQLYHMARGEVDLMILQSSDACADTQLYHD